MCEHFHWLPSHIDKHWTTFVHQHEHRVKSHLEFGTRANQSAALRLRPSVLPGELKRDEATVPAHMLLLKVAEQAVRRNKSPRSPTNLCSPALGNELTREMASASRARIGDLKQQFLVLV